MKQKLALFLFCTLSTIVFSQSVPMAFEDWKTTDGTQNFFYRNVTKTDASSNIYIAGATITGNGTTDILLVKKNSSGVTQWTKQYNGSANFHDFATSLYIDASSNVYITGAVTNNTVTFTQDLIVIKYNSSGTQQWINTYDGGNGSDLGKDITLNSAGGIFVTGSSYNSSGNADFLTVYYNTSGTQQWATAYDYTSGLNDGGAKIATKTTTAVTVTGVVTSSANNYKVATIQYAVSTGSPLSTNISTATITSSVEAVTDMVIDASNNTYISGTVPVSGQGYDYYTAKLTNSLTLAWSQTYDGASHLNDFAQGLQVDASGNVYVTGYSTSSAQGKNFTTLKYNSSGTQQWVQSYNSSTNDDDEATDLVLDASNNVYVTGSTSSSGVNNSDFYTIKYNSSGTKLWDIQTDGNGRNDKATNLALDNSNNVIVTGSSEITPGTYEYLTTKYDQFEVVPFTDINSETGDPQFNYLPNKGQIVNTSLSHETDILYYNVSSYPETYIAKNRLSFLQSHVDTIIATTDSIERIDLVFNDCNSSAKVYSEEGRSQNTWNFFKGSVEATNIHGYKKIISPEIYTGIDLHYFSNDNGIKAYFVVKPYADPRQIEILLQGQQSTTVTSNNLKINGLLGSITLRKPNVYNINGGTNVPITGISWSVSGSTVSISTGTYTTSQPLVIEFSNINPEYISSSQSTWPTENLDWCTYIGNSADEQINRVTTDNYNNKYIAGSSTGNNYPITSGVVQGNNVSSTAAVISKFNTINQLLHSTYYGGSATNSTWEGAISGANGIVVDSLQNVFVMGSTNTTNFPFPTVGTQPVGSYYYTTNNATSAGSWFTSFIIKMDSSMQYKLWGTHMGDANRAYFTDAIIDNNQNITVVGGSLSSGTTYNFPTPPSGAYYNTLGNGLLFRFSNNGVAQYATRLSESPKRIVYNKHNGDYFVANYIYASALGQKYKNPGGGAYFDNTPYLGDMYLARFNNQDSITWATAIGGTLGDYVEDMDIRDSTLILSGSSQGAGFPIKYQPGQYVDSTHSTNSEMDIVFIRFNSYTGQHIYSSYHGSSPGNESGYACAIDSLGNYFIAGRTETAAASFGVQTLSGFYNNIVTSLPEGFILSYSPNNNKRLTTYFGGQTYKASSMAFVPGNDMISDMALSSKGDLYMVGTTSSNNQFPLDDISGGVAYTDFTQNGTVPYSCCGPQDGFIAAFTHLNAVGIHELDKNHTYGSISVYPNPSDGLYNITIEGLISNKNINFNVYNAMGQMVHVEQTKTPNVFINKEINLSALTQGIYFINILQGDKSVTVKIIKQ